MLFRPGHVTQCARRHWWRSGGAGFLVIPVALAIAAPLTSPGGAAADPRLPRASPLAEKQLRTPRTPSPADPARPVLRLVPGADEATVAAANELYARLLDSVGLYTLIGDLKPMSDIVPRDTTRPYTPDEENRFRPAYAAALAAVESDLIRARVLWRTLNQGRFASLFVLRTDLVRLKIREHQQTFARDGIRADTSTTELLDRLEALRFRDLNRIHGYLYGFPKYAVEFFCRSRSPGSPFGIGKDRQAVRIPAFRPRADFVYVIPIENELSAEDRQIQDKAAAILAEYRNRRPRYQLPDGRLDAIILINDWYRDLASARKTSFRGPGRNGIRALDDVAVNEGAEVLI